MRLGEHIFCYQRSSHRGMFSFASLLERPRLGNAGLGSARHREDAATLLISQDPFVDTCDDSTEVLSYMYVLERNGWIGMNDLINTRDYFDVAIAC